MTSTDDPFDEGVPRNGRGQPTIIPLKRGKPDLAGKLVPYVRASTFAKALDDGGGLSKWEKRHAVIGVAISPDLAAMVAALGRNLNDYEPQDKRDLDAIIETAHDRSGGNAKANYGTAVHSLTEDPFGETERDRVASTEMQRDVDSYNNALTELGLEVVDSERFIVNDDLLCAGTYDHVYRLTVDLTFDHNGETVTLPAGTLLIGDKKTGTLHIESHVIQLAIYARGRLYDHTTGARTALDVSPQWGLVAHIARGEGTTTLHVVDLHAGWHAATQLAAPIRAWRAAANVKSLSTQIGVSVVDAPAEPAATTGDADEPGHVFDASEGVEPFIEPETTFADAEAMLHRAGLQPTDPILHAIAQTSTVDECHALWRANKTTWTSQYSDAVVAKYPKAA